jgi:uncharacterized lipoprotein YmbA
MSRDGDPMVRRFFRLENRVAADLVDEAIAPALAQGLDQSFAAEIPRELHQRARTSSRMR